MKKIIMAIAVLFALACNNHITPSNTAYQNKEIVNEKGTTILAGRNAPYMFKRSPYSEWFEKNYNAYAADSSAVLRLSSSLKGKTMEVFLGSWCGDSKREVPRMLKILDASGFDTADLHLIFVDYSMKAYKQSPQHEEKGKNIHHVPTFILYDGKNEIGRIVESPVVNLEKDMLAILNREGYVPTYKAIIQWQKQVKQKSIVKPDEEIQAIARTLKPLCTFWGEFNGYGYMLLSSGKKNEAYNIFRLNNILFPDKSGTYASLGEYYFITGNKAASKEMYEKVLQLKPDDANAKKMLGQL